VIKAAMEAPLPSLRPSPTLEEDCCPAILLIFGNRWNQIAAGTFLEACEGVSPNPLRAERPDRLRDRPFFLALGLENRSGPAAQPEDQADHHGHEEDEEQDLRDRGRGTGDPGET